MTMLHHGGVPPRRVAILRALQLGDLLCAVPALRAIRHALPESEITLIGLPWAKGFVERFGRYLDGFLEFPGYPGLPERTLDVEQFPSFLDRVRQSRFDVAIQLHGSGTVTNPLVVDFGARLSAGFFQPGAPCPDPDRFVTYPDHGLEVDRLLSLVEFLGIPARGNHLEFPLRDEDYESLSRIPEARALRPGGYACVHVGASTPTRRWPLENFAEVARQLLTQRMSVVLTGTSGEAELTRAVARRIPGHVVDLAGRTDLGALGALLQRARLLVSNDTGISHMADALRLPSVVISTGDNPKRWAPRDRNRHRVLCRAAGVAVREVISQVDEVLGAGSSDRERVPFPDDLSELGGMPRFQATGETIRS